MMELKAIETEYNGYRFRSRLEARWAVFFDALGVEYEYEPEGFELEDGTKYLPDFKVKCYGKRGHCNSNHYFDLWIEVKGDMSDIDAEKIEMFAGSFPDESEFCCETISQFAFYPETVVRDCDGKVFEGKCGSYCLVEKRKIACQDSYPDENDYVKISFSNYKNPIMVLSNIPSQDEICYNKQMGNTNIESFSYLFIDGDSFGAFPCADESGRLYLLGQEQSYLAGKERTISALNVARQVRFEHGETPDKEQVKTLFSKNLQEYKENERKERKEREERQKELEKEIKRKEFMESHNCESCECYKPLCCGFVFCDESACEFERESHRRSSEDDVAKNIAFLRQQAIERKNRTRGK